jgi:hypothetical protein
MAHDRDLGGRLFCGGVGNFFVDQGLVRRRPAHGVCHHGHLEPTQLNRNWHLGDLKSETQTGETHMQRQLTQLFVVAALFGSLTASTMALARQTASSPPLRCEKMTIDCWQKDEEMGQLSRNHSEYISQLKDAYA